MLFRSHLKLQLPWIGLAAAMVVVIGVLHAVASWQAGRLVGGSSLIGLIAGSLAGLIILIELLLWPRKGLRRFKLFPMRFWMASHIWLGLACGPLGFIHSGYRFGGNLSTSLMVVLGFVLLSGIVGWIIQNVVPSWMLRNLPAETIASQVPNIAAAVHQQTVALMTSACGERPDQAGSQPQQIAPNEEPEAVLVGAVQQRGRLQGKTVRAEFIAIPKRDWAIFWENFTTTIEPYLLGKSNRSELKSQASAERWFESLEKKCAVESQRLVEILRETCDQQRQFQIQQKLHWLLHGWIAIHAGVSIFLGFLLLIHIVLALRYI